MTRFLKALMCLAAILSCTLSRGQVFEPDSRSFFGAAVRECGVIPAVIFTADRITRAGRIGLAGRNMAGGDGLIHEGLEAYRPARNRAADPLFDKPFIPGIPAPATGGKHAGDEYGFVDYLVGSGLERDAALLLSDPGYRESDTLRYLRGWTAYSTKQLEKACDEFSLVPVSSPFYDKSLFFNVISNAHLGRTGRSLELLDSYSGAQRELACLERAGIALLRHDAGGYLDAAQGFSFSHYALSESETTLQNIYKDRFLSKRKSPALAAAASTLVPGLGKIYAGELGEGVASFLTVGSLAAITAENWVKCGPKNWKTILFGTLGTVFYLGNIYGSYVSVSIHEDFISHEQDTAILYHIHIPIRSIFN